MISMLFAHAPYRKPAALYTRILQKSPGTRKRTCMSASPLVEHSGFEPLTPTLPVGFLQSQQSFTTAADVGIARVCEKFVFLSFTPKSAVSRPVLWSENWSDLH